jgi:hypothetical protein
MHAEELTGQFRQTMIDRNLLLQRFDPAHALGDNDNRDGLLAFYDFPAEHWQHIRTANPIESDFATVRHPRRGKAGQRPVSLIPSFLNFQCWRWPSGHEDRIPANSKNK